MILSFKRQKIFFIFKLQVPYISGQIFCVNKAAFLQA